MPILELKHYGDAILREKARPIAAVTDDLRRLAHDMGETMYAARGIGLAANQVGHEGALLVYDTAQLKSGKGKDGRRLRDEALRRLEVVINPEILDSSAEDEEGDEGCLSIPGLEAPVWRSKRIRVRYRDLDWVEFDAWFDGIAARVLQHEIDHLNGVLFVDRLPAARRASLAAHLAKIRRGEIPDALNQPER